jgi:hypothetical protein
MPDDAHDLLGGKIGSSSTAPALLPNELAPSGPLLARSGATNDEVPRGNVPSAPDSIDTARRCAGCRRPAAGGRGPETYPWASVCDAGDLGARRPAHTLRPDREPDEGWPVGCPLHRHRRMGPGGPRAGQQDPQDHTVDAIRILGAESTATAGHRVRGSRSYLRAGPPAASAPGRHPRTAPRNRHQIKRRCQIVEHRGISGDAEPGPGSGGVRRRFTWNRPAAQPPRPVRTSDGERPPRPLRHDPVGQRGNGVVSAIASDQDTDDIHSADRQGHPVPSMPHLPAAPSNRGTEATADGSSGVVVA